MSRVPVIARATKALRHSAENTAASSAARPPKLPAVLADLHEAPMGSLCLMRFYSSLQATAPLLAKHYFFAAHELKRCSN